MNRKNVLKPLLLIFAIILFCSVLAHVFSGSETLAEYAAKHPEVSQAPRPAKSGSGGQAVSHSNTTGDAGENGDMQIKSNTAEAKEAAGNKSHMKESFDNEISNNEISNNEISNNEISNNEISNNQISDKENSGKESDRKESEDDPMTKNPDRVEYQQGFYYEPLSEDIKKRITGGSYPAVTGTETAENATNTVADAGEIRISYDELCYVSIRHYNFKGIEKTGELICNRAIAQDLLEIFYELYRNQYQIEQVRLIDEYGADDTLSMQDNNTSCFNYRVVDGTTRLSKHALGLAIDINPFFNPYVEYQADGTVYISPSGGEAYADRSKEFAYKIDENDLCYRLFKEHGFTWGGDWNSCKDYQHFQKVPE